MAQKSKSSGRTAKSTETSTKVTRITAADTAPKEKKTTASTSAKKKTVKKTDTAPKKTVEEKRNFFQALGEYFKGSWAELRQVRWPNRRTTWSLTLAVLVFTAFFVLLITLLDYLFQMLFERILG